MGDPVALLENLTATWSKTGASACRRSACAGNSIIRRCSGFADDDKRRAGATRLLQLPNLPSNRTEIVQPPAEGLLKEFEAWAANKDTQAEAVPVQTRASCPGAGCARCPRTGPACEKAPAGPAGTKCASRDPATATSSGKGPGRAKSTGAGCARKRRPSAGAGCADTLAPARLRFALTQRQCNCASPRSPMQQAVRRTAWSNRLCAWRLRRLACGRERPE